MKLSVIIPVYNEKDTVIELIRRTKEVPIDEEIIVIDDGSSDGTQALLKAEYSKDPNIKLIFHEKNKGKGSAIRTGIGYVTGDILIIQDADLEYDPRDFVKILEKFNDPNVDVVYGNRFANMSGVDFLIKWFQNRFLGKSHEIKRFHLFFGVQLLNVLTNLLYGCLISDEATCYKAFRKKVIDKITLRCTSFEFCPEVTAKVRKAGHKIYQVPISYHPRSSQEGKKLNWFDGLEAIWTLLKYRFVN